MHEESELTAVPRDTVEKVANALGDISKQVKSIKILLIVYIVATIGISVGTSIMAVTGAFSTVIRDQIEEMRGEAGSSSGGLSAGETLPSIRLPDADGKMWTSDQLEGKIVLLNFWATWCAPCRKEMPWFKEFQQTYSDKGFTVVAISTDRQGWDVVRPYIEELQPNFPVLVADENVTKSFGRMTSLPTTFLIHRDGRVHTRLKGSPPKSWFVEKIDSLLEKDPPKSSS